MNSITQDDLDARMVANFEASVQKHTRDLNEYCREEDLVCGEIDPLYLPAPWQTAIARAAAKSIGESTARRSLCDQSMFVPPSPLEQVMAHALRVYAEFKSGEPVGLSSCFRGVHRDSPPRYVNPATGLAYFDSVSICQQHKIDRYFADFYLLGFTSLGSWRVAVEVDGHEFHEKTKAQAEHDKKRDRCFAAAGYAVLRFTGSEVFRDPVGCAREAVDLALGVVVPA